MKSINVTNSTQFYFSRTKKINKYPLNKEIKDLFNKTLCKILRQR